MKTEENTDVKEEEKKTNDLEQEKKVDIKQRFFIVPKWEAVMDVDDGDWDF